MGNYAALQVKKPLRLRFAPSPTGSLHVGGARTALFNYLLARQSFGTFVLRIEDTDANRNRPQSEAAVLEDLRWLGLSWDEGPDCGGPYGPYRQSERMALYATAAAELLENAVAYRCYCTTEELAQEQAEQRAIGIIATRYGGHCAELSSAVHAAYAAEGRTSAIRLRVPPGRTVIEDVIHGSVVFEHAQLGDLVVVRANGVPTYNFVAAIDDAAMAIDLVVRGDEHLANTPYQMLILAALGRRIPQYAHVPLILNEHHQKLSKRHETVGVATYREQGYLPEALIDHLVLLGWSPGDDSEHWSLEKLTEIFSLERVGRSPSVYNAARLRAFNARAIRDMQRGDLIKALSERFRAAALPEYTWSQAWLDLFIDAYGKDLNVLSDAVERAVLLVGAPPHLDDQAMARVSAPEIRVFLQAFTEKILTENGFLRVERPNKLVPLLAKAHGLPIQDAYVVLRLVLTGSEHGAPFVSLIDLLGPSRVRERLEAVL